MKTWQKNMQLILNSNLIISIEDENLQNDLMITHKRHINLHGRYPCFSKISFILINEIFLEKTYLMFFCTFFLLSSQYYRTIFREVLDQLITEYKEVSKSIDTNVQSLAKISPKYIMKFNKIDAENISKMIQVHDTRLFYNEVQLYKAEISECDTISVASEFVHNRKSYLPLLCQAYEYLLTMPVTIASVERSFSKMKIVKNRLRTKMNDERLKCLLLCTLEPLILNELCNNELAKKWANNKTGRRI